MPDQLFKEKEIVEDDTVYDMSTPAGRSVYFAKKWDEWDSNEVAMSDTSGDSEFPRHPFPESRRLREYAKKHNLRPFWDYILKGRLVRFKDPHHAFFYKLGA